MARPSKFWSPERDQILRDHYPTSTASEICKRFDWNVNPLSVNTRASVLKIKKAPLVEQYGTTVKQCKGYRVITHRVMG